MVIGRRSVRRLIVYVLPQIEGAPRDQWRSAAAGSEALGSA